MFPSPYAALSRQHRELFREILSARRHYQSFHLLRRSQLSPRPTLPLRRTNALLASLYQPLIFEIRRGARRMATQNFVAQEGAGSEVVLANRLSESRSPYVRAHMNNPVAWQMWTPEALALAKKMDRLLFVSIGYSACHWCHVMERESFENKEVAKILNESFIPVKIDREERPDIDRIYMNYVQATTGGGGWPLNVFLTPDLEPLFGGTYWPGPESATQVSGHVNFVDILIKLRDVWQNERRRCLDSAKEITSQLRQFTQEGLISHQDRKEGDTGDALDLELLEEAYQYFVAKFDPKFAGFGNAPKFPTPVNLRFLLRLGRGPEELVHVVGEEECRNAQEMVLKTLRAMWRGGIKDQIGHGFARYSVTRDWSLPHFEKMLYDQGQLLSTYLDAYLISKDHEFLDAVHDISTYLTTAPIASPSGGFYSAEDADSFYRHSDKEKREGAFYVWTQKELHEILDQPDADIISRFYNVGENGNISPEHDAHDELINQNVLAVSSTPEELAKEFGMSVDEVIKVLGNSRQKLLDHRNKERPRPALDDKIVVAWNGLAIGALARVSAAIAHTEPERSKAYLNSAVKAAEFIKQELYNNTTGMLKRVYREGPGDAPAFADDYAFLISGLIDLYEATFDDSWLEWADGLQKRQIELFHDAVGGGFFSTAAGQADLILRLKDGMDNAEPSTNGISASNLNRLGSIFEDEQYTSLANGTAQAFEAEILQHPFLFASLLDSVVSARLGMTSVVLTGEGKPVDDALRVAREGFSSFRTLVRLGVGAKSEWLKSRNELLGTLDESKPTVQVCENRTCRLLEEGEIMHALK
ncbi:uncharacterized protein PV09_08463 [Verruconis gallopava]|uniref:Spermatogenesis-associated protein 20-like TRX domain-containing protein n=1 Tax=Verruconis gallopava TaxID=253628 RepID=A0A0D1YGM9_9PEZI|nr:uncharacterized protein PV09_08463 [Verruconis gallopava]KIV99946.1 hypothetical protein PV09_08463 [Verruconis gallopava]